MWDSLIENISVGRPGVSLKLAEMEKGGDTGDISLLFFLAGANFWAISAILGHFWAILDNFGSFLGYFGSFWVIFEPFFCANFFLAKN